MPVQNAFVATLFIYSILFIWCDTAEARRFTYLKEAKPYTPGELEIENWVTWKTSETVDRFDFRHELEYNFTRHMQLGFYLVDWRHTSIRDDGSQTEYLHSGVEFVWNFTDPVKDILGCSSYSEVLVGHERLVLEQKLLLQKNFGPLVATYNLVLEAKWEEENIRLYESPYHWAYDNGTWITDGSTNIIRDDESKYWYQRREAAWASKKVPDNHLPPVYNRSQVIEISPKLQESENFTIYCCVGQPPNEKDYWDWDEVELTLKYRFNESGTMGSWMTFDTISNTSLFNFNFTSPNGSGHYEFYSILEAGGTIDEAPPKADTEAYVNTSTIYSDFKLDIGTPLAMTPIPFNSSSSHSTTGNITNFVWDFGDGENSTEEHPSHTFDDDGTYYINLSISFFMFGRSSGCNSFILFFCSFNRSS